MFWKLTASPIGPLILTSDKDSITGLWMLSHRKLPHFPPQEPYGLLPVFQDAEQWLHAYFTGSALPPLPPLSPEGTPFQKAVWAQLLEIPYGRSTTYGSLSKRLQEQGISSSPQAVGGAVGRNPISILIPCHRVLGTGGTLTGYAGGLARKRALLQLEKIKFYDTREAGQ